MRKNTYYAVRYGNDKLARFSDFCDAMWFAEMQSARGGWAEVQHPSGLVGQYRNGRPTPEFAPHHSMCSEATHSGSRA